MKKQWKINQIIKFLSSSTAFGLILLGLNSTTNANEIVKLSGEIKLKRKKDNGFKPANFLDTLNYKDELQVGANSWVILKATR